MCDFHIPQLERNHLEIPVQLATNVTEATCVSCKKDTTFSTWGVTKIYIYTCFFNKRVHNLHGEHGTNIHGIYRRPPRQSSMMEKSLKITIDSHCLGDPQNGSHLMTPQNKYLKHAETSNLLICFMPWACWALPSTLKTQRFFHAQTTRLVLVFGFIARVSFLRKVTLFRNESAFKHKVEHIVRNKWGSNYT